MKYFFHKSVLKSSVSSEFETCHDIDDHPCSRRNEYSDERPGDRSFRFCRFFVFSRCQQILHSSVRKCKYGKNGNVLDSGCDKIVSYSYSFFSLLTASWHPIRTVNGGKITGKSGESGTGQTNEREKEYFYFHILRLLIENISDYVDDDGTTHRYRKRENSCNENIFPFGLESVTSSRKYQTSATNDNEKYRHERNTDHKFGHDVGEECFGAFLAISC